MGKRTIFEELCDHGFNKRPATVNKLVEEFKIIQEEKNTFESLKELFTIAKASYISLQNFVYLLRHMLETKVILIDQEDDKFVIFSFSACLHTFEKVNSPSWNRAANFTIINSSEILAKICKFKSSVVEKLIMEKLEKGA